MSYCRWSSDDFMCDLYCYEDVNGGWTTHVAARRMVRKPETTNPYAVETLKKAKDDPEGWSTLYKAYHQEVQAIPTELIDLPHAGATFNDATLGEFRERVVMLRDAGYHVPAHVLVDIDVEIAITKDTPTP